jgi:hypothetical protein
MISLFQVEQVDKEISEACDRLWASNERIRHVGFYDGLGRILFDSIRPRRIALEGTEEMHILNGTIASMINLWNPSQDLIGKTLSIIMIKEKLIALIVPQKEGKYFLIVLEAGTPLESVEEEREKILEMNSR